MNKPTALITRWWDFPAALILVTALLTSASRLVSTNWTTNLGIVQTLVTFGFIAGLALGKSRFSARIAFALATAYGAAAVPWQLGITIRENLPWLERMMALINRLGVIISQLLARDTVVDSLLFLVLMSILFWVLGVQAGYTLVRHGSAWGAALPAGIAMFVIHLFDPYVSRRVWYLAIYLFFMLILVARMEYLHRQNSWQKSKTALPPHLGLDFIRVTIIATTLIVLLSWSVPALANSMPAVARAWQPVRRAWNEMRDRFENAFASLNPSVGIVSEYYGANAILGRGNPLTDAMAFTVNVPANLPSNVRLYWRARTYDVYNEGQWLSTITRSYPFNPQEDDLAVPQDAGRWSGSFDIIGYTHLATLFSPAQPLWVSRPANVEYITNSDGTIDLSSIHARPSLDPGEIYRAQASISNATVLQLKSAGIEYPDWITARYLKLPGTITARTYQLAEQITAGLENPYEKTVAITEYLRKNITYITTLDRNPPSNQEVIDWFLFDYRQGFCNYYATAEVVLLRAVGIPARWAVGYAEGEKTESGSYAVRQRDAHAWPEVYFPGYGWVEFEPTVSQPNIVRLSGETNPSDDPDRPSSDIQDLIDDETRQELLRERERMNLPAQEQKNPMVVVYWIIAVAIGSGLLFLAWRYLPRVNWKPVPVVLERILLRMGFQPPQRLKLWARRAELPALVKAYLEINHALSRLGQKPAETDTPAERASNLGQVLPPAYSPAQNLVSEYQIEVFGRRPANLTAAQLASHEIRRLSIKAWMERLLARLQRPKRDEDQPRQ
ncbi:MAG: transglutaminase domain-containing protein [Anaerolineales bacterium]|nr:transglutaminase domain-containing protein [Anaerolineales bacterium]